MGVENFHIVERAFESTAPDSCGGKVESRFIFSAGRVCEYLVAERLGKYFDFDVVANSLHHLGGENAHFLLPHDRIAFSGTMEGMGWGKRLHIVTW